MARSERARPSLGRKLWVKGLAVIREYTNTKNGKAKSAKFRPSFFNLNSLVMMMQTTKVSINNKIDANFIKIISILYHKKSLMETRNRGI